jgi:tetratricopeptide (TPR) repeat protein
MGRPIVLADHEMNASVTATLLNSPDWRCIWFDPIAAMFVHAAYDDVVRAHQVDFAARHFRPDPATDPRGPAALLASARGLRNVASLAGRSGPGHIGPLVLLGLDHARRYEQAVPGSGDGWKMLGQLEMLRDPPASASEPVPRFRMPFDPVFDLSAVRATYALRRAVDAAPDDFSTLLVLEKAYEGRAMTEAAVSLLERLVRLTPINGMQARSQEKTALVLAEARLAHGPEPPATWQNREELRRIVGDLLARGRAATAATYLERATPADTRPWDEADRIATLWLHLGESARARSVWESGPAPPRPALRSARVAVTHLVEGQYQAAREAFQAALAVDADLFEAQYGLAILEQDIGRAPDALKAARRAEATAPSDVARTAARSIVAFVTPYAVPPVAAGR